MSPETLAGILTSAFAVAAAALTVVREWTARRDQAAEIRRLQEILAALPDSSPTRADLQRHIDDAVLRLVHRDEVRRRDPAGIATGAVFVLVAGACAWYAVGGRWGLWLVAGLSLLLGLVLLVESVPRVPRDDKGRRLEATVAADATHRPPVN